MIRQKLKHIFIAAALGFTLVPTPGHAGGAEENACRNPQPIKGGDGEASWYGSRFHGRKTANGERFNMNAMTAAHRTLPLGTKVQVKNRENGESVVLTINDRGPYAKGRILDVSYRAAEMLDFDEQGKTRVSLSLCM